MEIDRVGGILRIELNSKDISRLKNEITALDDQGKYSVSTPLLDEIQVALIGMLLRQGIQHD